MQKNRKSMQKSPEIHAKKSGNPCKKPNGSANMAKQVRPNIVREKNDSVWQKQGSVDHYLSDMKSLGQEFSKDSSQF